MWIEFDDSLVNLNFVKRIVLYQVDTLKNYWNLRIYSNTGEERYEKIYYTRQDGQEAYSAIKQLLLGKEEKNFAPLPRC